MKLLIDIPEEDYKFIKDLQSLIIGSRGNYKTVQYNVINAIKNGISCEEPASGEYVGEWAKGFHEGFNVGTMLAEAFNERPQGEWEESHIFSCGNILRMGADVIEHKCKNCGRWSIKWARAIPDNFCSNCGADMRKGGEEE